MASGCTDERPRPKLVRLVPIPLHNPLCPDSPAFQMASNAERHDEQCNFVFDRLDRTVIEMVIMIVRQQDDVDFR